ncbi:hypothetical protein [Brevibacillus porteri]|uniref:hypothetical protein n=1 Tax=Brevibacillus porteri TaxID=2126350 RepID=UPI002E1B6D30|nr:hypothetical protein [Brevibacillus porteri]MED2131874.1 hypothetical protein [Brevibacillus porteri]MED2893163.1 hypothetical protein [Brevibacillus porteri]
MKLIDRQVRKDWNLRDDLHEFDLRESQASPDVWGNREALYLEGMGAPVFLRQARFWCARYAYGSMTWQIYNGPRYQKPLS